MRLLLTLLLFFVLGTIFYLGQEHEEKKVVHEVISVGWIGPLSGATTALGIDSLNATKLALQEYQKNKTSKDPEILLLSEDDAYDNKIALQKYRQMIESNEKPAAIIVDNYSALLRMAPLALRDDVIIIDPIDNDQKIASLNRNIFLIAKETEALAGLIVNAIIDQGKKNIAIIYYGKENDFMWNLAHITQEILTSNGIHFEQYQYPIDTTDFHQILEKSKSAGADGYVFFGYREIGFAMKQTRELGITSTFYSVNVITDPVLQENSGGAVNGTYFAHFTSLDGNRVETDEFLNKFFNAYGRKPFLEWTAMQSYDAARILFSTIQAATHETGDFTENLRNKLLETSNFEGVSGNITILPSGASRGIYTQLYIMKDQKAVPVNEIP